MGNTLIPILEFKCRLVFFIEDEESGEGLARFGNEIGEEVGAAVFDQFV